jgi:hypothetical protein
MVGNTLKTNLIFVKPNDFDLHSGIQPAGSDPVDQQGFDVLANGHRMDWE